MRFQFQFVIVNIYAMNKKYSEIINYRFYICLSIRLSICPYGSCDLRNYEN